MTTPATCNTCKFWTRDYYWGHHIVKDGGEWLHTDDDGNIIHSQGLCRRHAPNARVLREDTLTKGFPVTFRNDWCGEWKEEHPGEQT